MMRPAYIADTIHPRRPTCPTSKGALLEHISDQRFVKKFYRAVQYIVRILAVWSRRIWPHVQITVEGKLLTTTKKMTFRGDHVSETKDTKRPTTTSKGALL